MFKKSAGNTSKPSKSIEPWNIIHITNNSYTEFILPHTYDKHQWLPLRFCKITPDDGRKLRPKHVGL